MNDDLTDRLRAWATLDRIEAAPVLSADLTEAADRIGDLELRLAECEADRTILAVVMAAAPIVLHALLADDRDMFSGTDR